MAGTVPPTGAAQAQQLQNYRNCKMFYNPQAAIGMLPAGASQQSTMLSSQPATQKQQESFCAAVYPEGAALAHKLDQDG